DDQEDGKNFDNSCNKEVAGIKLEKKKISKIKYERYLKKNNETNQNTSTPNSKREDIPNQSNSVNNYWNNEKKKDTNESKKSGNTSNGNQDEEDDQKRTRKPQQIYKVRKQRNPLYDLEVIVFE